MRQLQVKRGRLARCQRGQRAPAETLQPRCDGRDGECYRPCGAEAVVGNLHAELTAARPQQGGRYARRRQAQVARRGPAEVVDLQVGRRPFAAFGRQHEGGVAACHALLRHHGIADDSRRPGGQCLRHALQLQLTAVRQGAVRQRNARDGLARRVFEGQLACPAVVHVFSPVSLVSCQRHVPHVDVHLLGRLRLSQCQRHHLHDARCRAVYGHLRTERPVGAHLRVAVGALAAAFQCHADGLSVQLPADAACHEYQLAGQVRLAVGLQALHAERCSHEHLFKYARYVVRR